MATDQYQRMIFEEEARKRREAELAAERQRQQEEAARQEAIRKAAELAQQQEAARRQAEAEARARAQREESERQEAIRQAAQEAQRQEQLKQQAQQAEQARQAQTQQQAQQAMQQATLLSQRQEQARRQVPVTKPVIPDVKPITPAGFNIYTETIRQGQQVRANMKDETPFIKYLPIKPQRFKEIEQQGEIVTVERTTNPDKYIIRVEVPEKKGQYIQTYATKDEIEKRGAEVPVGSLGWWFKPGTIGERMVPTQGLTKKDIVKAYKELGLTPPKDAKELPGDKERAASQLGYKSVNDEGFQIFLKRLKKNPYAKEFTLKDAGGIYSKEAKTLFASAAGVNWDYDGEMRRSFVPTGDRSKPEYISITDFGKLSEADRLLIVKVGVSAFNAVKQARYADYIDNQPLAWRTLYNQNIKAGMDKADALTKATTDYNGYVDRVNASRSASRVKWERELKEQSPELYEVYAKAKAKDGYLSGIDALNAALPDYNARVSAKVVTAAEADELTKKQEAALATMEPYKTRDGKYRLFQALVEGFNETKKTGDFAKQKEILQAASLLFDAKVLGELRQTREWLWDITPPGRDGKQAGLIGDWQTAYAALPGGLAAAAGYTKQTPLPQDDVLALVILSAATSGKMVADKIAEWRSKNKNVPISDTTIAVLDQYNNMTLLDPKTFMPPGGITLGPEKKILLTDEKLIPPRMLDQQENIKVIRQPLPLEQLIPANVKTVLLLPTPGIRPSAEESLLMSKMSDVKTAETALRKTLPADVSKEIDWDNILEDTQRGKAIEDTTKALDRAINITHGRTLIDTKQLKKYETAHQEYLRKLELWRNAWKSYVNSIQPDPVKGSVTPQIKYTLAKELLKQKEPKTRLKIGQAGIDAISSNTIDDIAKNEVKIFVKQALRNLPDTYTKIQLKTALQIAKQRALAQVLEQVAQSKVNLLSNTATLPAVQSAVNSAINQASATLTSELARPNTRAAISELTDILTSTTALKIENEPKGQKQKEAWTPEDVKSAIAWSDGVVVHAIKAPYRRGVDEKTFSKKRLPKGLEVMKTYRGKGSQQKSAKVTGVLPKKLTVDVGNQDVVITANKKTKRVSLQHFRDTNDTVSMLTIDRNRGVKFTSPDGVVSKPKQRRTSNKKRRRIVY